MYNTPTANNTVTFITKPIADEKNAFMVCAHNRQAVSCTIHCGGLGCSQSHRPVSISSTFSSTLATALTQSLIKEERKVKLQNFLFLFIYSRMTVANRQFPSEIK